MFPFTARVVIGVLNIAAALLALPGCALIFIFAGSIHWGTSTQTLAVVATLATPVVSFLAWLQFQVKPTWLRFLIALTGPAFFLASRKLWLTPGATNFIH